MATPRTEADKVMFMKALLDYLASPDMPKMYPNFSLVVKDAEERFSATISAVKVTKRKTT